jgi:hypothetical protein
MLSCGPWAHASPAGLSSTDSFFDYLDSGSVRLRAVRRAQKLERPAPSRQPRRTRRDQARAEAGAVLSDAAPVEPHQGKKSDGAPRTVPRKVGRPRSCVEGSSAQIAQRWCRWSPAGFRARVLRKSEDSSHPHDAVPKPTLLVFDSCEHVVTSTRSYLEAHGHDVGAALPSVEQQRQREARHGAERVCGFERGNVVLAPRAIPVGF